MSGYEPVIVVFRHPDYDTETTEHYMDVPVIDIDLGSGFDITSLAPGDEGEVNEYAQSLREQIADLPADHAARLQVEQIIDEYLGGEDA